LIFKLDNKESSQLMTATYMYFIQDFGHSETKQQKSFGCLDILTLCERQS
jgi:hypothetical protein